MTERELLAILTAIVFTRAESGINGAFTLAKTILETIDREEMARQEEIECQRRENERSL